MDFNTDFVSDVGKMRACNYFAVKTSREFKRQMTEEFDYMVTPNVFDCTISMQSDHWEAERVFGTPGFEIPEKGRLFFMARKLHLLIF